MCINPSTIYLKNEKSGETEPQEVECRVCWSCKVNRKNDWIGRCIAEQLVSDATFAVTLTHAGDGVETKILDYSYVQKMLKRLRKAGFQVRYLCVGEHGARYGRTHWHIVLFFSGSAPDVELNKRINWPFWPHGFCFFQTPDYGGFAYLMKYLLKEHDRDESRVYCSKYPPLGYDYFTGVLVREYVALGVAPRSFHYSWPEVQTRSGRLIKFLMKRKTRRNFLEAFEKQWFDAYGKMPFFTENIEREIEKRAREESNELSVDLSTKAMVRRWANECKEAQETGAAEYAEQVKDLLYGATPEEQAELYIYHKEGR